MSFIFIGLGNPGDEYEKSRHSAGRIVLSQIAEREKVEWKSDKTISARKTNIVIKEKKVSFILPEVFMNQSGKTVAALKINPKKTEELVVLHDDIDLPLGSIRIICNRGAGGHNGVLSVKRALKTENFTRIRIGVCPTTPGGKLKKPESKKVVDFVIADFKTSELEILCEVGKKIEEAITVLVIEGRAKAATLFNG